AGSQACARLAQRAGQEAQRAQRAVQEAQQAQQHILELEDQLARGGDRIRSACAANPLSAYGKQDSSFIRFTSWKDKNEKCQNLPVELVPETGYGQLDFILAVTLPPNPCFNIDAPKLHVLAHITEAKGAKGDASTQPVSYTQFGSPSSST
ncbi:hypothetical protein FRC06_006938, partial [Ceratobasidium sp. 370]